MGMDIIFKPLIGKKCRCVLLSVVLLAGCTIHEPADFLPNTAQFQASLEFVDTRTSLDEGLSLCWTAGDLVSIFSTTANQPFRFTGDTGDHSGGFDKVKTDGAVSGKPLNAHYAVYPYQESTTITEEGILSLTLPSVQHYAEHSFGLGVNTMVAVTENLEDHFLCFKNLCGYLVVSLYGNATIQEISICGNSGEKLAGAATCHPLYGEAASVVLTEGATDTISIDCGEGVKLGNTRETATDFWFAIPPVTFEKGFSMSYTTTDGGKGQKRTTVSRTITRNVINRLSAIDVGFYDLSSAGTANCYIVNAAGDYCFNASVKGNGTESVGSPASADVLWESFGNETTPAVGELISNVSLLDGYVSFTASEKKGNAVIAVRDAKGTILWSWHIWLTDQPEEQVYFRGAGIMMDRNLGATMAAPGNARVFGLLYQWGRKDPFLGLSGGYFSSTIASTASWPSAESRAQILTGDNALDFAISHPMAFIKTDSDSGDWYCSDSSCRNDNLWSSEKSVYDPCPAGWQVPDGDVWISALAHPYDFSISAFNNDGYDFSGIFGKASPLWYPLARHIEAESGSISSNRYTGVNWSCTVKEEKAYLLYFNLLNCYPKSNQIRGQACSVRCFKTGSSGYYPVESVSLENNSLSLIEGSSQKLIATIAPANASNKGVTWTSSDTSVATVEQDGVVTAVSPGTASVTVRTVDGGKTASCIVTVLDEMTGSVRVSLNKSSLTLTEGSSETLVASITPEEIDDKRVLWSSSDNSVATVDDNGKVTGLKVGTTNIVVTSVLTARTDTCVVSVIPDEMEYPWDGEVVILQSGAPELNLIILGDGFVKADFDDGTYDRIMRQIYADFFSVEPFTTLQSGFSVYYVKAPSPQRFNAMTTGANGAQNSDAQTKFSVRFTPNSTAVSGDNDLVKEYAKKALGDNADNLISTATIIVAANQKCRAGTNHTSWILTGDYGKACDIAYFGLGRNDAEREELVHHEACGHGFGLLGDEYGSNTISSMSTLEWWKLDNQKHKYGVHRNVDKYVSESTYAQLQNGSYEITTTSTVYWADLFNTVNNYESPDVENLGVFEGALTYSNFFCRPTKDRYKSIMNANTGIFNAPSRRQIYYRYLRLSGQVTVDQFGSEEELNRFLEWDASLLPKLRARTSSAQQRSRSLLEGALPLAEPVIQVGTWSEGVFIPVDEDKPLP